LTGSSELAKLDEELLEFVGAGDDYSYA